MVDSSSPTEEHQRNDHEQQHQVKDCSYKTKTILFLGRQTQIILQNDNGPCPLLAICNVLLLRNILNLSPDDAEVYQEKLLSLVADRLIDSNSNVDNKDAEYIRNQQQNIADAIDLLPRLTTGIDVNIKFKRIDDFEFTRECTIFDLLDIPLYHGWIVDPQDYETANAIGTKSYNALTSELVALETQNIKVESQYTAGEDSGNSAVPTTATLEVPSPCLPETIASEDASHVHARPDAEEEVELLRALKLSEGEMDTSVSDELVDSGYKADSHTSTKGPNYKQSEPPVSDETLCTDENDLKCLKSNSEKELSSTPKTDTVMDADTLSGYKAESHSSAEGQNCKQPEHPMSDETLCTDESDQKCLKSNLEKELSSTPKTNTAVDADRLSFEERREQPSFGGIVENSSSEILAVEKSRDGSSMVEISSVVEDSHLLKEKNDVDTIRKYTEADTGFPSITDSHVAAENSHGHDAGEILGLDVSITGSDSTCRKQDDVQDAFLSKDDDTEPRHDDKGETTVAEITDERGVDSGKATAKDGLTQEQGELIKNFLKNSASQLTFAGLFCLQEGLKERELCVFFRNNHFSTMFKYESELYLLATDQGYLNQPDLVWEKLNEVNGNTVFMTSNFKEFKADGQPNSNWDADNAISSTAEYLASVDSAAQAGLDISPDLKYAMELQQQEFEQQQLRHSAPATPTVGASRLYTGPQMASSARESSSSLSKPQDGKSKEKCTVM